MWFLAFNTNFINYLSRSIMKKFLQKFLFFVFLSSVSTIYAQNVGINSTGAAPNGDALLDISSTNKGLLIPRVSIPNLTLIGPITGGATTSLLVYNTNAATGLGYYYWDGADWIKFTTGNPLVDNGLYYNTGANRVRLGGPLVENTTITQGVYGMTYNLTSTGDFNVQDAGVTHFQVRDNGYTYFGDDTYWNDASVTGTTIARLYDSGNDGVFQVYMNGGIQHSINSVSATVFNEQGYGPADFRIESDFQNDMFVVDAGTNRIGINAGTAPAAVVDFRTTGENIWLTYWENNNGTNGAAAQWNHTNAANGNRVAMGVTNYSGSINAASAIIGLSLNGTTTGSGGIGVIGHANNESGDGVQGNLSFSGGYVGWAGYFNADVYCGGTYWGSDRRLKRDISPLTGALELIDQIDPVTYYYDTDKYPGIGFDEDRLSYGFIAQDVENVIPELVKDKLLKLNANQRMTTDMKMENKKGLFKVVNYSLMIPILTQAVKEQQSMIEAQNQKMEELEQMIKELKENK
jgi:hypothetical protein